MSHVAHFKKGEFEKALGDLDTALSKRPIAIAFLNGGATLAHLSEWDRALADFKEATKLDPVIERRRRDV